MLPHVGLMQALFVPLISVPYSIEYWIGKKHGKQWFREFHVDFPWWKSESFSHPRRHFPEWWSLSSVNVTGREPLGEFSQTGLILQIPAGIQCIPKMMCHSDWVYHFLDLCCSEATSRKQIRCYHSSIYYGTMVLFSEYSSLALQRAWYDSTAHRPSPGRTSRWSMFS